MPSNHLLVAPPGPLPSLGLDPLPYPISSAALVCSTDPALPSPSPPTSSGGLPLGLSAAVAAGPAPAASLPFPSFRSAFGLQPQAPQQSQRHSHPHSQQAAGNCAGGGSPSFRSMASTLAMQLNMAQLQEVSRHLQSVESATGVALALGAGPHHGLYTITLTGDHTSVTTARALLDASLLFRSESPVF